VRSERGGREDSALAERPRILVLDLLESYARERDVDVGLVRRRDRDEWVCALKTGPTPT
jgi:hypothetical protein